MASATTGNYWYTAYMNLLLSNTTFTPPSSIYVALMTTVPNLDGTGGVEVSNSGTGYARRPITAGRWTGPSGTNLTYTNSDDVSFATPTANWGTIVGACLYDSAIGGSSNLLYVATFTTPRVVSNGDGAPKILAGQISITRATC